MLLSDLSDCVSKFATYYPHYQAKLGITKFKYNPNLFHKSDRSVAFFFTYDGSVCVAKSGLVTKKAKLLRTSSVYTTDIWNEKIEEAKTLSLMLSLILAKIRLEMSKYIAIFKYPTIFVYDALSKFQLSLTLAANLISIQHPTELLCNLIRVFQKAEFSPNDQTLSNKQIQWQTTNESWRLYKIIRFDIEKRHWERFLIIWKKSYQH